MAGHTTVGTKALREKRQPSHAGCLSLASLMAKAQSPMETAGSYVSVGSF